MGALVILAAGMGSRFGGVKQLAVVGPRGELLLDYTACDAHHAGYAPIVLVTRTQLSDALEAHLAAHWPREVGRVVCCQDRDPAAVAAAAGGRTKPLGTLHAALVGIRSAGTAAGVCNADDLYGPEAIRALASLVVGGGCGAALYPLRRTLAGGGAVSRALCSVEGDELWGVEEGTVDNGRWTGASGRSVTLDGTEPVSMNLWALTHELCDRFDSETRRFLASDESTTTAELTLPTAVDAAIRDGTRFAATIVDADCTGITHAEDLAHLRGALAERPVEW